MKGFARSAIPILRRSGFKALYVGQNGGPTAPAGAMRDKGLQPVVVRHIFFLRTLSLSLQCKYAHPHTHENRVIRTPQFLNGLIPYRTPIFLFYIMTDMVASSLLIRVLCLIMV